MPAARVKQEQLGVPLPGAINGTVHGVTSGLGMSPDRAEQARRGANQGNRIAAQRIVGKRPGYSVERVLEHAGDRVVVLGNCDQDAVGRGDRVTQLRDRRVGRVQVLVRIVGRQLSRAV
jgi:hypothetical protein